MMLLPDLGSILVWVGLIAVVGAIGLYLLGGRRDRGAESPRSSWLRAARWLYIAAALSVVGVAAVHATLLLTHRFDIDYVYRYSARGLSPGYLFSTFWAGQQGSFLLWAFWTALLGIVFSLTAGRRIEPRVMPVYGCVLAFLLVLLVVKSPFAAYAPLSVGDPQGTPTNGMGLNPLLENP